jgi:predicted AlkP superfamily pyrophosphatase or phosphodiesterase
MDMEAEGSRLKAKGSQLRSAFSFQPFLLTSSMLRHSLTFSAALVLLGARPVIAAPTVADSTDPGVDLVVMIVVDQMHPEYFTRFHDDLTGGLRRLYDHGAVFLHGMQDHAMTLTAPGHSTVLSGRSPASTNIVSNSRGVPDPVSPIIGAPKAAGASPAKFRGTALYDWMLARDSNTVALSVSRKDRGAILPIGRARTNVFWYAYNGTFSTSTWYGDSLPSWLTAWNARRGVMKLAGTSWMLALPAARYTEPDTFAFENRGKDTHFPHLLPTDSAQLAGDITDTPFMDSLTLDLALEGTRQLKLGTRRSPDLLVVSLSATDAVGHAWGPDSREMHDQIIRLDRALGWFLDSLGTMVPSRRTIVALTADHGGGSITEYARKVRHETAGNAVMSKLLPDWRGAVRALEQRWHTDFAIADESGLIAANVAAMRARGIDVDSLSAALARALSARPEVARVFTPATLAAGSDTDLVVHRWRRQLPADFGWLAAVVLKPGYVWSSSGMATHGTPSEADATVPIVFMGPRIEPHHYDRAIRTTSIGPTLARLVGVAPTEPVDGPVLPEVAGAAR